MIAVENIFKARDLEILQLLPQYAFMGTGTGLWKVDWLS